MSTEICACPQGEILKSKSCLKIKKLNHPCNETIDFCIQKFSVCENTCKCAKGFSQIENVCSLKKPPKENFKLIKASLHNQKSNLHQKPIAAEIKSNIEDIELIILYLIILLAVIIAILVMSCKDMDQNYPVENVQKGFYK